MKSNYLIAILFLASFIIGGCANTENSDYKATIIPATQVEVTSDKMHDAAAVIGKRLSSYGIPARNIKLEVNADNISLTVVKGASSPAAIRALVENSDKLEFWETYENSELTDALGKANSVKPLYDILRPMTDNEGRPMQSCLIGLSAVKDTSLVNRYMQLPEIKALFPDKIRFFWSQKPYKYYTKEDLFELHAIRVTLNDWQAPLDGRAIVDATEKRQADGQSAIQLTMTPDGTAKWSSLTKQNIGRCIAIVLNGYVRAYPVVQMEITGGKTEISGDFTDEEAKIFSNILKSGQLPVHLKIISEQSGSMTSSY